MSVKLRKRKISKTKQSLYLDIHMKGMERQKDTSLRMHIFIKPKDYLEKKHNEETLRQAETLRAQRQLELQSAANGVEYIAPTNQTFFEFFDKYIEDYPNKDIKKFTSTLHYVKTFLKGRPFYLDQNFINAFGKYLTNDCGLNGETPVVYFTRLKRVCKDAYKKRVVKVNPVTLEWKMSFDRHYLRKEVLDDAELAKLVETDCGNKDLKRLFLFCCNTGLRFGDAKRLTWGKIKDFKIGIEQGKTGRHVFVPLNENARNLAGTVGGNAELVFEGVASIDSSLRVIKNWYKAAKIDKHVTTHTARHTFCTNLVKNKVDFKTIITLMGWSEESGMRQIARYAHFVNESAQAAVDSLPKHKLK